MLTRMGSCRTGLAFLKSIRPGRDDRQMLAIAEPRAKSNAECFYRPYGTDLPFTSFPSTSYWATFTESLRNKSPHHTILAVKLTRMGACRILGYFHRVPSGQISPALGASLCAIPTGPLMLARRGSRRIATLTTPEAPRIQGLIHSW